jgi:hypothetical protein
VRRASLFAAFVLVALTAGCGGEAEHEGEEHDFDKAADRGVCVAQAHQVKDLPNGFPSDFPFPHGTVVYHAEDRGEDGVVVTGVSPKPLEDVLAALNGPAQDAGFKVTNGETEEHDAEANWSGNGYRGRWAIRESSECPGETVVQVLAAGAE